MNNNNQNFKNIVKETIADVAVDGITAADVEKSNCYYCRGIESHGIVAVKTVIDEYLRVIPAYDTPYNFCPNCGRKIKEATP